MLMLPCRTVSRHGATPGSDSIGCQPASVRAGAANEFDDSPKKTSKMLMLLLVARPLALYRRPLR